MCLCEYLDTMATGAIEIERKNREVEQRKGGPKTPGGWKQGFCDTDVYFELAVLFIVCSMHSLSLPRTYEMHALCFLALGVSRRGEMLHSAYKDIHHCLYLHLCVSLHFSVHIHAHYFPNLILCQRQYSPLFF